MTVISAMRKRTGLSMHFTEAFLKSCNSLWIVGPNLSKKSACNTA